MLTVADYIEYVKEKCEERAEKRAEDKIKNIVANMLRQGMSEKQIQISLGISADEVRKLIHECLHIWVLREIGMPFDEPFRITPIRQI